jgi:hypothetical protein
MALLNWHVLLTPATLEVNGLWASEPRRYSYDRVMQIRVSERVESADGSVEDRFGFALYFDDGWRWSSLRDPSHATPAELREVVSYVSEQSGIPAAEISLLAKSEQ